MFNQQALTTAAMPHGKRAVGACGLNAAGVGINQSSNPGTGVVSG